MRTLKKTDFFFPTGVVTQQGSFNEPLSMSAKILFLVGFLFGMLVFNSFTANIISTLSASQSIESVQELINYGKIQ